MAEARTHHTAGPGTEGSDTVGSDTAGSDTSGRRRAGVGAGLVAVVAVLVLGTRQQLVVPYSLGLTPGVVIVYVALVLLLLCWLAGQRLGSPHRTTVLLGMGLFATTVCSSAALMVRVTDPSSASTSVLTLVRDSWLLGFAVLVMVLVRTSAGLEWVMRGIVIGATLSGAVGLLTVYAGIDLSTVIALPGLTDQGALLASALERAGGVRPQGMAGHPLELSAVLVVSFPLAVGLATADRARGRSGLPWALASLLLLVAALSTISRSAVIAAVVAFVVMAWTWPVRRMVALAGAAIVSVFIALALGVSIVTRIAGVLTGGSKDNSLGSRSLGLDYAFQVLPQHPWLGQGVGTYDIRRQPVLDNYYLGRAVEAGLIGLLALVVMLIGILLVAVAARRRLRETGDAPTAELANGIVGSVTAFLVIGLILDVPGFVQITTLQYLLVALAGVAATVAGREPAT